MDPFRLGGLGCVLGLAAWALGLAGAFGAGPAAGLLSYLLAIASAGLVVVATRALRERFGNRLFQLGGILVLAGTLATLVATLAALGAMAARDVAALSSALVGVLAATLAALLGWMFIGASLVVKRKVVAQALGMGWGAIVLGTGILLILAPLLRLVAWLDIVGLVPLAFVFFALAKGAPAAAAPPAA